VASDARTEDWQRLGLVPPRRLGQALRSARLGAGWSIESVAQRSDGTFDVATLSRIERGVIDLTDPELAVIAELYHLHTAEVIPSRSRLVVDLDEGRLEVPDAGRRVRLDPRADRDEVLARYLALVYAMRGSTPGTPLAIRVDDLEALGRSLEVATDIVAADLDRLMAEPHGLADRRHRLLRRKVLVPAAGVLVAVVGVASLVLVQRNDAEATEPPGSDHPTVSVPVSVGTAVVQERLADGTPGPVVVRGASAEPEPSDTAVPAAVADPAVESR
jgi:transcriptional regulator with XRE-family HTH domain